MDPNNNDTTITTTAAAAAAAMPALPPHFRLAQPFNFGLSCNASSIPLQKVSVKANVIDFLAEVTIIQTFLNQDSEALEAIYRFPLDSLATLTSFTITIDDNKTIRGQVEEKAKAAQTYDDALASGNGGFLLQEDAETKDIFSLRVGNLPPKAKAVIELTYVVQVDEETVVEEEVEKPMLVDGTTTNSSSSSSLLQKPHQNLGKSALRLVIPTAVAPRYVPASDQPPELLKHAEAALATWPQDLLTIEGKIKTATPIVALAPLTYKEQTTCTLLDTDTHTHTQGHFKMTIDALSDDFVLLIHLDSRLENRAWLERRTGALTVAASLKPHQFSFQNEGVCVGEYIFVIDRSGSMQGANILQARQALALCVSALPVGSTFNIVSFGSTHTQLFPEGAAVFNDQNKQHALTLCQHMGADMGGTEILGALQAVNTHTPTHTRPRQVLVITDGQVGNTAQVIEYVRKDNRETGTRYFSFGIGVGASRALVKGIAEAGGGYDEFIVEGERLQGKIMRQMNRALEPALTNVTLEVPVSVCVLGAISPKKPRPLFSGGRCVFYALLDKESLPAFPLGGEEEGKETMVVRVKGVGPEGEEVGMSVGVRVMDLEEEEEEEVEGGFVSVRSSVAARMLEALAVKSVLKDLEAAVETEEDVQEEDKALLKQKATELSIKSGVLCKYTSYVAVEERKEPVTGAVKTVHLPLQFVNRQNMGSDPWSYGGMQRQHLTGGFMGVGGPHRMMMASCAMPMPMAYCASGAPSPPMASMAMPRHSRGMMKRGAPPPQARRAMASSMPGGGGILLGSMSAVADAPECVTGAPLESLSAVHDVAPESAAADSAWSTPGGHPDARFLGPPVRMDLTHTHTNNDNNEMQVEGPLVDHVAIVTHQKASGEWTWDAAFLSHVLLQTHTHKHTHTHTTIQDLEAAVRTAEKELGGGVTLSLDVWATALILAHLDKAFAEYREEWEAAAKKGKRWLVQACGGEVDGVMEKAAGLV